MKIEDQHFESRANDTEGLGVSLQPISPLTELQSDESFKIPDQASRNTGTSADHIEKKHRNAVAHVRRARKRVKAATSGHGPNT